MRAESRFRCGSVGHQERGRAREISPGQERHIRTDLEFNIMIFNLKI